MTFEEKYENWLKGVTSKRTGENFYAKIKEEKLISEEEMVQLREEAYEAYEKLEENKKTTRMIVVYPYSHKEKLYFLQLAKRDKALNKKLQETYGDHPQRYVTYD